VADQLALLSILPSSQANYATVRLAACNYIYSHPDDFLPFLPSSSGEDGPGSTSEGLMSQREFESYCLSIRDTAVWGGEPEILALSRAYNIPIHVVQSGRPPIVIHNPTGTPNDGDIRDTRVVRISYHRRMYGLGEVGANLGCWDFALIPEYVAALQFAAAEVNVLSFITIYTEYNIVKLAIICCTNSGLLT